MSIDDDTPLPMSWLLARFEPPWSVEWMPGGYQVVTRGRRVLLRIYAGDEYQSMSSNHLLRWHEAQALAHAIADLSMPPAGPRVI